MVTAGKLEAAEIGSADAALRARYVRIGGAAFLCADASGERGKETEIHVHGLIGACLGGRRMLTVRPEMAAGDVRKQRTQRSRGRRRRHALR